MPHSRKLAAIMFTDIQGYTSLMQQDEAKAVQSREKHRQIFKSTTEKFNGRILQYYGDGTLSIFDSAIDAVTCAIEMQLGFQQEPAIPVRIGIHTGDILFSMDAARLYTLLEMPDEAIPWFEKGYRERSVMMVTLKHYWVWDPIRNDPRFIEIYNRMNFGD